MRIDKGFIISMASLFSQQKELLEEVRGIVRVKIMDRKKSGSRGGDKKKKKDICRVSGSFSNLVFCTCVEIKSASGPIYCLPSFIC